MGKKSKSKSSKKTKDIDSTNVKDENDSQTESKAVNLSASTSSFNSSDQPREGPVRSESDSELELLAAIGAPPELVREVMGDIQLRKKLSQIIKSSEEETAAILKQNSAPSHEPPAAPPVERSKTPEADSTKGECASCHKDAETRCTGCRNVFYCSKDCQKEHWKIHKDVCRPFMVIKMQNIFISFI